MKKTREEEIKDYLSNVRGNKAIQKSEAPLEIDIEFDDTTLEDDE